LIESHEGKTHKQTKTNVKRPKYPPSLAVAAAAPRVLSLSSLPFLQIKNKQDR